MEQVHCHQSTHFDSHPINEYQFKIAFAQSLAIFALLQRISYPLYLV